MMNQDSSRLKMLASELLKELRNADTPDDEAIELLQNLETDVQDIIDRRQSSNEITDLLINLESRFAVDHPVAERTIRDIVDTLNKIGI